MQWALIASIWNQEFFAKNIDKINLSLTLLNGCAQEKHKNGFDSGWTDDMCLSSLLMAENSSLQIGQVKSST